MAEKVSILFQLKDQASKGLKALSNGVLKLGRAPFSAINKGFAGLKNVTSKLFSIPGLIAGGVLGKLGADVVDVTAKFEQWSIAFETLLGSGKKAAQLLDDIKTFAAQTPFELPGLVDSSKKLLAFGFQQEEIIDTMRRLGDIAAGVGTDKLPTLVASLGKIRTKGRASLEELNMMLEAGVPILDSLAEGFEVTKEELFDMITKGEVGFEDVNKALTNLTDDASIFGGLMAKQSDSLSGIFSNIGDNLTQTALAIGNELLPLLKDVANAIKDFTSTERLPRFIANLKIWAIDVKTVIKLTAESLKEILSEPFRWQTYRTIFQGLIDKYTGIWKAIKKIGRGGLNSLKQLIAEEKEDQRTFEEEVIEIKRNAAKQKAAIRAELAEKIKVAAKEEAKVEINQIKKVLDVKEEALKDHKTIESEKTEETKNQSGKRILTLEEELQKTKKIGDEELNFYKDLGNQLLDNKGDDAKLLLNILKKRLKDELNLLIASEQAKLAVIAAANWWNPIGWEAGAKIVGMEALKQAGMAAIDAVKFADGGIVPGSSFTGDRIPAALNSGELVLNRQQQSNLGKMLFQTANNPNNMNGSNSAIIKKLDSIEKAILEPAQIKLNGADFSRATYNKQKTMLRNGQISNRGR